jgi:hypothetical protein
MSYRSNSTIYGKTGLSRGQQQRPFSASRLISIIPQITQTIYLV